MSKQEEQNTAKNTDKQNQLNDQTNEVVKLVKQLEEEKEARLMVLADFDNYKKRIQKEREELNLLGNATILNILLEIQDDLERAISEIEDAPIGLTMIKDKVVHFLKEHEIEEIQVNPEDSFDPSFMEAIGKITVKDDKQDNKVIHVERKGYKLKSKDLIIRTVRVIVGKKD